jgi:hypothetical protein
MKRLRWAKGGKSVQGANHEEQNPGAGGNYCMPGWKFVGLWPIWLSPIKRPNIANIFHPVVGGGAAYELTSKTGEKSVLELSIIGKENDRSTARLLDGNGALEKRFDRIDVCEVAGDPGRF